MITNARILTTELKPTQEGFGVRVTIGGSEWSGPLYFTLKDFSEMKAIMELAEADSWETMINKFVRADLDIPESGEGGRILGIGHVIDEKWFRDGSSAVDKEEIKEEDVEVVDAEEVD